MIYEGLEWLAKDIRIGATIFLGLIILGLSLGVIRIIVRIVRRKR